MKKQITVFVALVLVFWLLLPIWAEAQQQRPMETRTGRVTLSAALGLQGGTADGTAFAIAFSGDYYLDRNFSVGPLLQLGMTDDFFQIAPTVQAKFTFDLRDIPDLKPHVQGGIGFIHADLDRRGRPDQDDTSFLIPLGFGADYRLTRELSVGSTVLFNFTNLNDVRNEKFFVTWLIGAKLHF